LRIVSELKIRNKMDLPVPLRNLQRLPALLSFSPEDPSNDCEKLMRNRELRMASGISAD